MIPKGFHPINWEILWKVELLLHLKLSTVLRTVHIARVKSQLYQLLVPGSNREELLLVRLSTPYEQSGLDEYNHSS